MLYIRYIVFTYCIFLLTLAISGDKGMTSHTDDAVVVAAVALRAEESDRGVIRHKRQYSNDPSYQIYPATTPACLTSRGVYGTCLNDNQCYPTYTRFFPYSSGSRNWMLRFQESCTYVAPTGRQEVGVCCDVAHLDAANRYNIYMNYYIPNRFDYYPSFDNPLPAASWPPPLPTHPPEHQTAPTHPTTQKPSYWPPTHPTRPTVPPPPNRPPPPTPIWPAGSGKPTTTTRPPYRPPPTFKPTTRPPWQKPDTMPPWQKPPTVTSPPPWQKPPTMTSPPPQPEWPLQTKPTTTPAPDAEDVSMNFDDCGVKNGYQDQERIVGGHNADPGEWPWMVAILTNGRLFCGGSLIDDTHILTAAHCVAHMNPWDVARLRVNLGDYNIKSKGDGQHIERKVKKVVRHRGFDPHTLYNDIALLTLSSPVTFTKNIRPICLPKARSGYSGRMATVIGWGSLREMGPTPGILQEVNIPIWSNQDCKSKYGQAAPGGIVDTFLCAGKASKDSCSGDSGGPLMINDGKWHQVGIVSWGIGCGKGQFPGVYTRITSYMNWINKNINI